MAAAKPAKRPPVAVVASGALLLFAAVYFAGLGGASKALEQPALLLQQLTGGSNVQQQQQQQQQQPTTSSLEEWAAAPMGSMVFEAPQSRCRLLADGSVRLPPPPPPGSRPFLFDTAAMPKNDTSCTHCDPNHKQPLVCCGVCIFESRLCDTLYPGDDRSGKTLELLLGAGHRLQGFTPCELFQRIRGRTLWFMGDSQTWHFFYSAECFLREFAPALRRTGPLAPDPFAPANDRLVTVTWPGKGYPVCLELALGTRVCAMRVDSAADLQSKVLPKLQKAVPNFADDLMVFNTGLHYGTPGADGKPPEQSQLVRELKAFGAWRQKNRAKLPALVWMDTPVQHFNGPDGSYPGKGKQFSCVPLAAWQAGDPLVVGGGRRNVAVAPLIPAFADAHLRTWNESVPLWDTHKPGECTHWCSPSAYHLWLYLLNGVLRDSGLGGAAAIT